MNRVEKIGVVTGMVGGVVAAVGFIYMLGTEGAISTQGHSFGWAIRNMFTGIGILIFGLVLVAVAVEIVKYSQKKFRRVLVRNIVSNKVTARMVEDVNEVVLSDDEVICGVDRRIYRLR